MTFFVISMPGNGQSNSVAIAGTYALSNRINYSIISIRNNYTFTYTYGLEGCVGEVTGTWRINRNKLFFKNDSAYLNNSSICYPDLSLSSWTVKKNGIKPADAITCTCSDIRFLHYKIK